MVGVRWTLGEDHAFRLTWRKTDGLAPPAANRIGFGSTIPDRIAGRYVGGRSELRFEPDDAVFTIVGPLDASSNR